MTENKIKKNLELAAGITGIVVNAGSLIILFLMGVSLVVDYFWTLSYGYTYYYYGVDSLLIIVGFILIFSCVLCIPSLIFSILILRKPRNADGTLKDKTAIRIISIVFAFLVGNWISAGLEIGVICQKDLVEPKTKTEQATEVQHVRSLEGKIADLKELKELELIDETTFNAAVLKMINKD